MKNFNTLHPICSFAYFLCVILLVLLCRNPIVMLEACIGALLYLWMLEEKKAITAVRPMLPIVFFILLANMLTNHRGVTYLFFLFNQWITLESGCYGLTAGLSLMALVLWFGCCQEVLTSDKFLYLFGQAAPGTALLISMAMNLIPKLEAELGEIRDCQELLYPDTQGKMEKLKTALRHVSTLLGWSLENAVEQTDSMKARGYGIKRRTTFHLFRFETRDGQFLMLLFLLAGSCLIARCFGLGTMEFYPRMDRLFQSPGEFLFYLLFLSLVLIPGILEWKEILLWRSYDLKI